METYYKPEDLPKFSDIGQQAPDLAKKALSKAAILLVFVPFTHATRYLTPEGPGRFLAGDGREMRGGVLHG